MLDIFINICSVSVLTFIGQIKLECVVTRKLMILPFFLCIAQNRHGLAGWECLFSAIDPLTVEDMDTVVYIRNEGHTILEAMQRQLGHYSYHVGQIVYLARLAKQGQWAVLEHPQRRIKSF
jgi:hypothetical protein